MTDPDILEGAPEEEDFFDNPREYHYYNYFYNLVLNKTKRHKHYIMFHHFYEDLENQKTFIEYRSFLEHIKQHNYGIITILFETLFLKDPLISDDADKYSYLILKWFFSKYTSKTFPYLFDSNIGNKIYDSTKEFMNKENSDDYIETIRYGLDLLEIFIRNGGDLKLAVSVIYFDKYVALASDLLHSGKIETFFPSLLRLIGAFVLKFFKNFSQENFLSAVNMASQVIEISQETMEASMRFYLDCLYSMNCNFLDFLYENGMHSSFMGFLLHQGSVEFQSNLFDFILFVSQNASDEQFNNMFLPIIDWSNFSNIFESDPFNTFSFCQSFDVILTIHPSLIDSYIIQLFLNILNDSNRFGIEERKKCLLILLSHCDIMNFEQILAIFENGVEETLTDTIDLMTNLEWKDLINFLIPILGQFLLQGDDFITEISSRWSEKGLFEGFNQIIDDHPLDIPEFETFEQQITEIQYIYTNNIEDH